MKKIILKKFWILIIQPLFCLVISINVLSANDALPSIANSKARAQDTCNNAPQCYLQPSTQCEDLLARFQQLEDRNAEINDNIATLTSYIQDMTSRFETFNEAATLLNQAIIEARNIRNEWLANWLKCRRTGEIYCYNNDSSIVDEWAQRMIDATRNIVNATNNLETISQRISNSLQDPHVLLGRNWLIHKILSSFSHATLRQRIELWIHIEKNDPQNRPPSYTVFIFDPQIQRNTITIYFYLSLFLFGDHPSFDYMKPFQATDVSILNTVKDAKDADQSVENFLDARENYLRHDALERLMERAKDLADTASNIVRGMVEDCNSRVLPFYHKHDMIDVDKLPYLPRMAD